MRWSRDVRLAIEFSTQQRRWRLAERHRLTAARRTNDVVAIADDLVALHSSDPATVHLSAAVRMKEPSIAAVERALYADRSLIRHHAMRRTLWVMTPATARLAHGAATAKIARAERKRTIAAMVESTDITDPDRWIDDALAEITALLDERGTLTTRAIGQALPHLVVPVLFGVRTKHPAPLNAHTKVLQGAGFDASLVRAEPVGSWNSAEYLWAPTERWVGGPITGLDEVPAATELLDMWLRRFGPASETDIKWWFGWTASLTRKALKAINAEPVNLENNEGFLAAGDGDQSEDPGPWVRLLPGLDPTPMGWKERDWHVAAELVPRLFDRFGNVGPTVWVDGEIVGGWVQRPDGDIAVELATSLNPTHQALLEDAITELQNVVGDVVVRPRFPAPVQKELFSGKGSATHR